MTPRLALLAALALSACGADQFIDRGEQAAADAKLSAAEVRIAIDAVELARRALEVLGLLPSYTCGEPRGVFAGRTVDELHAKVACATVVSQQLADADALIASFPASGCRVNGHEATGRATLRFSGGEDRFDAAGDLRELALDGHPLHTQFGYGKCGDETRYWAATDAVLAAHPDVRAHLDVEVAKRDGLPIIGETRLVVNATGTLARSAGTDRIAATELEFEVGSALPKTGMLEIDLATGHHMRAVFDEGKWLGSARVTVDDHDPVTVPIP